jgi:hypothetical protein
MPFTRGPITIQLTSLFERPRELTLDEREAVEDLVVPHGLPSGERVVNWSCAACGSTGTFIEGRNQSKTLTTPFQGTR